MIIWEELGIWVAWFILYLRANNSAFKDIMSIMIVYSSDNVLKISLSSFLFVRTVVSFYKYYVIRENVNQSKTWIKFTI